MITYVLRSWAITKTLWVIVSIKRELISPRQDKPLSAVDQESQEGAEESRSCYERATRSTQR
jgi:hypothetical protein